MENKNVILLRHSPLNVKFDNSFYTNQVEDDDPLENYIVIDVTSRCERNKEFMKEHPTFSKDLSPFFIGPVIGSDGARAEVFEIFWQCGKVYPCHDNNGKPNESFFAWRDEFYRQKECSKNLMRHACESLGYKHKDTKYFAYFDKEKNDYIALNYVEVRKKVYIKEYAKLVYNTESFKWLKSLVESGKKVALVDFDVYNFYSKKAMSKRYESYLNKCKENKIEPRLSIDDFLNIKTMKDVVNSSFMAAGHGFVIKMLLDGSIIVEGDKVVDKYGILE